jgi:AcrR family transcriptional regulator
MRKGEQTRQAIIDHALKLATQVGFQGLTIGRLADELNLSKSGLFAHFGAKEDLQIEVLKAAVERFIADVVRPALAATRGEPRVRALFERNITWERAWDKLPGGCPIVAASIELDDCPGRARDFLVQSQRDWSETLANAARAAVREGHFRADLDCDQFAYEFSGIMLAYHHAARLMKDPRARERAEAAFDALLRTARASAPADHPPRKK